MLDVEFDALALNKTSYAPKELLPQIDKAIDAIYGPINNGVYRAGFAVKQEAYDEAVTALFAALDGWDDVLGGSVISAAIALPRRIGVCSRHCCDLTPLLRALQMQTCATFWTTPI